MLAREVHGVHPPQRVLGQDFLDGLHGCEIAQVELGPDGEAFLPGQRADLSEFLQGRAHRFVGDDVLAGFQGALHEASAA